MSYPGGKGRCFQKIISLMPEHETYIETHLGSGAVMLAKQPAKTNIGIDIDPQVVSSWKTSTHTGVDVIQMDALVFLQKHQFSGRELIYADPPYMHSTRRITSIYRHEYCEQQHVELLDTLRKIDCCIMISGYRCDLYDDKLSAWHRSDFVVPTQTGLRQESVWTNFGVPTSLHDFRYIGEGFREREAIRRRREGILRRIERLPAIERNAVIAELASRYDALRTKAVSSS